jgi:hypothetical protein
MLILFSPACHPEVDETAEKSGRTALKTRVTERLRASRLFLYELSRSLHYELP